MVSWSPRRITSRGGARSWSGLRSAPPRRLGGHHDDRTEDYPRQGRTARACQAARQRQPGLQDDGLQPRQLLSLQGALRQGRRTGLAGDQPQETGAEEPCAAGYAEAIAEAVQRPTMKFVVTKTPDLLDLQALHRVRERLVSQRTGIINQIRAFLLERGVAVRQGRHCLRTELPSILATRTDVLPPRMLRVIEDLAGDWRRLDARIEGLSSEIEAFAHQDQHCERLMTVPGIGPIISSAMVAAIGTGDVFSKGRDFGAWLGLVPKQISTGDRTILGSISKRGNRYLRALFAAPCAWRACTRTAQHTSRRAAAEQAAKPLRK